MDLKVSDLRKRLNKMRGKAKEKANYIKLLTQEVHKMEKEQESEQIQPKVPAIEQRQRFLENEIHKTSLKMMEGDMVRKKYDVIIDMLRKEQMHYTRQLKQLEKLISTQMKDIGEIHLLVLLF